jgi:hypothetical protein
MIGNNPTTQTRHIVTASRDVGAKLPSPVLESYERATRITQAAQSIYPPQGALMDATIAALDAGRDPASDPAVQRAHLAMQIGASDGMGRMVGDVVAGQTAQVFSEHADAIVKAWVGPFNKAAATLARCHERIGDVSLEDTAEIMRMGGDIARVWADARDAATTIERIDFAWSALALLTRFAPLDPRFPALRITSATPDEWQASGFERQTPGAWAVQRAGLALSLADGAEYVHRIAAVQVSDLAVSA